MQTENLYLLWKGQIYSITLQCPYSPWTIFSLFLGMWTRTASSFPTLSSDLFFWWIMCSTFVPDRLGTIVHKFISTTGLWKPFTYWKNIFSMKACGFTTSKLSPPIVMSPLHSQGYISSLEVLIALGIRQSYHRTILFVLLRLSKHLQVIYVSFRGTDTLH